MSMSLINRRLAAAAGRSDPTAFRKHPRTILMDRLAELLAPEENGSNAERIRQMREAYFADVDALRKSGRIKIPR